MMRKHVGFSCMSVLISAMSLIAQEKSVKPGINDAFKNPDVREFQEKFEGESREVFAKRKEVLAACKLKPGMVVADIGAGTGLYTRMLAKEVGLTGQVFAVDISPKFLEHIQQSSRAAGLKNVSPVLCNPDSVDLPPASIDLAFICDTYHHFEFPARTLASLKRSMKPDGRVVLIDFIRIPGKSSDWILNHVRAGQDVVEKEFLEAGFEKVDEVKNLLTENYFIVLQRAKASAQPSPNTTAPIIPGYGAVVPLPDAPEPPLKGSKVVLDVTGVGKNPQDPLPGLVRAATLLNLGGTAGLKSSDLDIVVVLHGDATSAALSDEAYFENESRTNPNGELLKRLHGAGVKFLVCGQSLARKGLDPKQVRTEVRVAASAISAVINLQARGYAFVPVP